MRNQINHFNFLKHKLEGDKTHKHYSFNTKKTPFSFLLLTPLDHFALVNLSVLYREEEATTGPILQTRNLKHGEGSAKFTSTPWAGLDSAAHSLSLYPVRSLYRTWLLQNCFIYGKGASFCSLLLNSKLMKSMFLKNPQTNQEREHQSWISHEIPAGVVKSVLLVK